MKIGSKLTLMIVLIVLSLSLLGGVLFYIEGKAALEDRIIHQLESVRDLKEAQLKWFIEEKLTDIESIASGDRVIEALSEFAELKDYGEQNVSRHILLRDLLILKLQAHGDDMSEIFIILPDGSLRISTDIAQEGKIRSGEEYFEEGLKGQYVQMFRYDISTQTPSIILSRPLKSADGKVVGVIGVRLRLGRLMDMMTERAGMGSTGETILVNEYNLLVSKSRFWEDAEFKVRLHAEAIERCIGEKGSDNVRYEDYRGVPALISYKWLPERRVCLIAKIDESEAFSQITAFRNKILGVGIVMLLLAAIIGLLFSETISRPIRRLRDAAVEVGSGNFDVKTTIKTDDEIGELASTFNKMAVDLKRLHIVEGKSKELLKEEVRKKTLELDEQLKDVRESRMATLNMMEDLDSAYATLKEEVRVKDELFNITSHELKSPLVPIIGYADLLTTGKIPGTLTKKQRESLEVITRNALRLSLLIEDVLDIARLQAGKMKFNFSMAKIGDVLREVEQRHRRTVEKEGLHLLMDVPSGLPTIMMDRARLVQVFSNLVNNALKFTEKGAISIHAAKKDDFIIVDVADTGIGLAKDDLTKIFDKFYQAESSLTRKYGGSGLGLPIVRGILKEHGGTINVSSQPGKGSVFTVSLPVKTPKLDVGKRKLNIAERIRKFRRLRGKGKAPKGKRSPEDEVASFFS